MNYSCDSPGSTFERPRRTRRPSKSVPLPIVDGQGRIVGWTATVPKVTGQQIRHREAERLVGAIDACFVEIEDPAIAARAGAPSGWTDAWRCLAICSAELTTRMTPERMIVRAWTACSADGFAPFAGRP